MKRWQFLALLLIAILAFEWFAIWAIVRFDIAHRFFIMERK